MVVCHILVYTDSRVEKDICWGSNRCVGYIVMEGKHEVYSKNMFISYGLCSGRKYMCIRQCGGSNNEEDGYLSGTIRAQQLRNVLDEHQVAVEMCEFSNNADEVAALNAGQVDAILMASMRCTSDYQIIVSFNPSDVYFTCNPNDA